jgi:hypothetical protein
MQTCSAIWRNEPPTGVPLGELVNGLLKREIQIIESVK